MRGREFNPQLQPDFEWPPSFALARSYLVQVQRNNGIDSELAERVGSLLDRAELLQAGMERNSVFAELNEEAEEIDTDARAAELAAGPGDAPRLRLLATAIRDLTRSLR